MSNIYLGVLKETKLEHVVKFNKLGPTANSTNNNDLPLLALKLFYRCNINIMQFQQIECLLHLFDLKKKKKQEGK